MERMPAQILGVRNTKPLRNENLRREHKHEKYANSHKVKIFYFTSFFLKENVFATSLFKIYRASWK